jgi:hypothetical protein
MQNDWEMDREVIHRMRERVKALGVICDIKVPGSLN